MITEETRVGYMTIDILMQELKQGIKTAYDSGKHPDYVYYIQKYNMLQKYMTR